MKLHIAALTVMALTLLSVGCSRQESQQADQRESSSIAVADGSAYLLAAEPESALDVIEVRKQSADGDEVVIAGRIGGSENPWIEGRAAFSIVDSSLQACSDIPGDGCPKPWDYCCETSKLAGATALIKVVDENGELVKVGAKELLNVEELATVVAEGTAERDDAGNVVDRGRTGLQGGS